MTLLLDAGGGTSVAARGRRGADGACRHGADAFDITDRPRRTLDDVLSEAWEGLAATARARCPVCATPMTPRWSAGAGVVGGRCGGCGSELV